MPRTAPSTPPSPPSLRSWLDTWLRLLSPTDDHPGSAGWVLAGLRLVLTGSVLLAAVITVWVSVALLIVGAWQLLSHDRLGAALMSLLGGAVASVSGAGYRRWKRRRRD